jgi:hypothetical protein
MADVLLPETQDEQISQQEEDETEDLDVGFVPPSVHHDALLAGNSFDHFSTVPNDIRDQVCVMGIDEAGRGPVLGKLCPFVCTSANNQAPWFTRVSTSRSMWRKHYSRKRTPLPTPSSSRQAAGLF